MTSEVVVMNRWGVALAADSAVTIKKTANTSKSRDTGLKLFMLSKYHPVGVMVYNDAALLGVPWETIIKLYRKELGDRKFDTLEEYGWQVIDYLNENQALFPIEVQDKYYLQALKDLYWQIDEVAEKSLSDIVRNERLTVKELRDGQAIIATYIQQELQSWKEKTDCFEYESSKRFVGRLSGKVHDLISEVFKGWGLDNEAVGYLWELAILLISKNDFSSGPYTGVVIAGFGDAEHFPSVQDFRIGGIYENKLKYQPPDCEKITDESSSIIKAFAYTDMVFSFLYGVTNEVWGLLKEAKKLIQEMSIDAINVIDDLSPAQREEWKKKIGVKNIETAQEFYDRVILECGGRKHKIIQEIENLPHNELAQVASTLVNLNSFQQRMSPELETVGGPVDVAVISKGDGFIWIERKHYFRKELNEHFFQNYFYNSSSEERENESAPDKQTPDTKSEND